MIKVKQIYLLSITLILASMALAVEKNSVAASKSDSQHLVELIRHIDSMQAEYTEQAGNSNKVNRQIRSGQISIAKPLKWAQYQQTPTEVYEISDGQQLWQYDVDFEQLTIQTLSIQNSQWLQVLQSESSDQIERLFSVEMFQNQPGYSGFYLMPVSGQIQTENLGIEKLKIEFVDKKLTSIHASLPFNEFYMMTFSEVKLNPALSDDEFTLIYDDAVDILDLR